MRNKVLLLLLLNALGGSSPESAAAANPKPNIVMIVVDDLGYADLSCLPHGATDVRTPSIDRLANRGIRFTAAYATAPICNAARIALMTGRYQQRQGVKWYGGKGLHRPDLNTIAEAVKAAGYTTGYIGKFHHGSSDKADGRGFPLNHGFDVFYGFSGGTKHYLHHASKYQEDRLSQGPMWVQREKKDVEGFTTELFGKEARDFLRDNRDQPFYLHLSFNAVHNFTHQLPDSYLKEKGLKGFTDLKPGEDLWKWRKKIGFPAHPEGRDYYLGQLHLLDREIGRVMDELNRLKLDRNTSVFLVSDNGGSLVTYAKNRPLRGGKYTLCEGGIRSQMIANIPGITRSGTVTDAAVSALDLFPTICDLTGADKPADLDGVSLLPLLKRPASRAGRGDLFWETGRESAVRSGNWKLLITRQSPNPQLQIEKTPKGTFLYDLANDPGEKRNLADRHPQHVAALQAALQDWKQTLTNEPASDSTPIDISGVYPHLTMWNNENECGTGAVVPWQGRLWAITYAPHQPGGSTDKLYEITPDLKQIIFPNSVGGTPANRMIHRESNQLLIGPYLIDAKRNVRVISPKTMYGRLTGNARHLTDPQNKVYYATMEEGLYEVDVNTLAAKCLIRDGNGGAPKVGIVSQLPGYHGKGLYSGQGRLMYANNGERHRLVGSDPTIPSGALAQWFGEGDWQLVRRHQFTEITGPGGIHGSSSPEKDPVWTMGWDARSVVLGLLENKKWHFYRLPKGSHSYDGSHGWNTEWPRIREIGEEDLLATMHGTFWRFPSTFSMKNSAGIAPRSNYLKVIGDFCRWNDRIVLGCDDSAKAEFMNTRTFKARHGAPKQSNSSLWFVEPEKLDQLGPAIGRGSVWLRDDVTSGQVSDLYLFSGYDHRQIHLSHQSEHPVTFTMEVDRRGTDQWTKLRTLKVGANAAVSHVFAKSETGAWIRLKAGQDAQAVTVNFQYRNVDPRSARNDGQFAGIATPGKAAQTFGLMRSLAYNRLGLAASSTPDGSDAGYYELNQKMQLIPLDQPGSAQELVTAVAQPSKAYSVDAASVLIIEDSQRYRLPKNADYETPPSREPTLGKTLAEHLASNLALGAKVKVSSTHADYVAANAVDGSLTDDDRWIGKNDQKQNWIELDLGEAKTFQNIWVVSGWDNRISHTAHDFDIQVRRGDQWETIPGGAIRNNQRIQFELLLNQPVSTRHLRLVTNSKFHFRIYEIALFEERPEIRSSDGTGFGLARVCREVATERDLLNVHGTFYELPARNAQGLAKVRPVATHNLAIHDFCSHNGLLLFTGIDANTESKNIFRSEDGKAAVWAGVVDDLWKLGKPRGIGGPWKNSQVKAGVPSDPYLMTGYDRKTVRLDTDQDATITLEVDVDGTGLWIPYRSIKVGATTLIDHTLPEGFSAYWVRAVSDTDTTASVVFTYH